METKFWSLDRIILLAAIIVSLTVGVYIGLVQSKPKPEGIVIKFDEHGLSIVNHTQFIVTNFTISSNLTFGFQIDP